jgi:flagellar biosynthesis/type III secretory pathway chaperone
MAQDIAEPGNPEPGPDNFSFEDYLEGNSTFPVFEHTAFLDQRSGSELGGVLEELEGLVESLERVEKDIRKRTETSANSFVDSVLDALQEERAELEEKIDKLSERVEELKAKIVKSGITLVFQVKTPEELGAVTREATRQFHKENPHYKDASENDLDYITARSRYTLTAQISHFCTEIKLPDGRVVPPPNRSGADLLLKKLIASETMRLMESVGTGLSASRDWADKLDAGFPGGSSHLEEVGMGATAVEDGKIVVRAPADHADGAAL